MLALALVILEGAFRKWVPLFQEGKWRIVAYFSKDIVFALLLLVAVRTQKPLSAAFFEPWLKAGIYCLLAGALVSLFFGWNLAGSVLTLRAVVILPFLAWLAIPRLRGLPITWPALVLAGLTLMNFLLASYQNQLPAEHFLNRYATDMEFVVEDASGVRATGTFAYITGLGLISSAGVWAGLVLLALESGIWVRLAGVVSLVAGLGCGLASVSRGPIVVDVVMVSAWLVFSRSSYRVLVRNFWPLVLLTGLLLASGYGTRIKTLWEGVAARHAAAGDSAKDRAFGQLGEMIYALRHAPFGRGFGTEQVGGNFAVTGQMSFTTYESQFPRIVMETGAIGLLGFFVICGGSIVALQRARREAVSPGQADALLATQLLLVALFYTNVVFNHTSSALAWIVFAAVAATDLRADVSQNEPVEQAPPTRRRFRRSRFAVGRSDDRRDVGTGRQA